MKFTYVVDIDIRTPGITVEAIAIAMRLAAFNAGADEIRIARRERADKRGGRP